MSNTDHRYQLLLDQVHAQGFHELAGELDCVVGERLSEERSRAEDGFDTLRTTLGMVQAMASAALEEPSPDVESLAAEVRKLRAEIAGMRDEIRTRALVIENEDGDAVAEFKSSPGGVVLVLSSTFIGDEDGGMSVQLFALHEDNLHVGLDAFARGNSVMSLDAVETDLKRNVGSFLHLARQEATRHASPDTVHMLRAEL